MSIFQMWMVDYHYFNFLNPSIFLIKRFLDLMQYKIHLLVFKFKRHLLKPKLKLN